MLSYVLIALKGKQTGHIFVVVEVLATDVVHR